VTKRVYFLQGKQWFPKNITRSRGSSKHFSIECLPSNFMLQEQYCDRNYVGHNLNLFYEK